MMLTTVTMHNVRSAVENPFVIGLLLVLQVAMAWASLQWEKISLFCTVPTADIWAWVAYVHIGFGLLFLLGIASLRWVRGRTFYVSLLALGLAVLPLQWWLVSNHYLTCDGF